MTTHLTKIWWDSSESKMIEKVISEAEIYKVELAGTPQEVRLGANEVLRVTKDGQFIWHEDADRMIEEGDFSFSPAMPHILKALRKQRKPLTDEEIMDNWLKVMWAVGDRNKLPIPEFARAIEAAHGIKENT